MAGAPAPGPDDAHRGTEVARLAAALSITEPGLHITGISGPGGVGKSYLLAHVLESRVPAETLLKLSVDGSNEQARGDFFGLLEGQLAKSVLPPPARPRHDYFPRVRKVAWAHRALVESVSAELGAGGAPPAVRDAAVALLKAGRRLNKAVPKSREYVDAIGADEGGLTQTLDEVWNMVSSLRALQGAASMPGPIRDLFGGGMRARVKVDLYNLTADALVADVEAALALPGTTGRLRRLAHAPIPGKERLLLVIDDFEALAPTLEEFLVGALIPRLAEAPFSTALVILGRDELEAMHPAWAQHCRRWIKESIRLSPFDHDAAIDLLAKGGVPEERREELYKATQGFPFLLGLLVEELGAEGADSALFLRKFFDRTTRWMSSRERGWFSRICYLDEVNLDTLGPLFPGEDVEGIQDWFEREASIRDPAAPVFRVRPLIREKVLRYLELRSPSKHRAREEQARR